MLLVADTVLASIPELVDMNAEQRAEAMVGAEMLYAYVQRHGQGVDESDARAAMERLGMGPDDFTASLAVLSALGRVLAVAPALVPKASPAEAPASAPALPERPQPQPLQYGLTEAQLEERTVEDLRKMAASLNIAGRSSMDKGALVDAILAVDGA
jgi:hypothetical protein